MPSFLILRGLPAANTLFNRRQLPTWKAAVAKTEQPLSFSRTKVALLVNVYFTAK
jgi:hypothetical protein